MQSLNSCKWGREHRGLFYILFPAWVEFKAKALHCSGGSLPLMHWQKLLLTRTFLSCIVCLWKIRGSDKKKKKKRRKGRREEGGTDRSANQEPCPCLIIDLAGKRRWRLAPQLATRMWARQGGLPVSYSHAGRCSIRFFAYTRPQSAPLRWPQTWDSNCSSVSCFFSWRASSLPAGRGQVSDASAWPRLLGGVHACRGHLPRVSGAASNTRFLPCGTSL